MSDALPLLALDETNLQARVPATGDTYVVPVTLNDATGNETAFSCEVIGNKATSGNITLFEVDYTDTSSPGTVTAFEIKIDSVSVMSVNDSGDLTIAGNLVSGGFSMPGITDNSDQTVLTLNADESADFAGDITLVSGKGIEFSSGDVLDVYEEGTWTPVLSDGTNWPTHTTQVGHYVRIGNMVTVTGYITISSKGSLTGTLYLLGFPFSTINDTGYRSTLNVGYSAGMSITAGESLTGFCGPNQNSLLLKLWDSTGGNTNLDATEITATFATMFEMTYRI